MYKDLDVLRNHRQDLVDQAVTMKDSIFTNKVQRKEEELDVISQIKEQLNDATIKKKNVLYNQKQALSS